MLASCSKLRLIHQRSPVINTPPWRPQPGLGSRRLQHAKHVIHASGLNEAAREAQTKFDQFVTENELKEKAQRAAKEAQGKLKDTFDEVQTSANRKFKQLDAEYQFSEKAQKTAKRVEEAWKDADQNFSIKRKIRNASEYVRKRWPVWRQQLDSFGSTWYGKVTILAVICVVLSTPVFWSLLHIFLLLWWLSIPASLFLLGQAQKKQAERFAEAQRQQQQRQQDPFGSMFWNAAGAQGKSSSSGSSSSGSKAPDGPIIDAEWVSLDEGDVSNGQKRGRR